MLGGIWVTTALAIMFILLAAKTFGWLFFNATNVNFINNFFGYTTTAPTVPIWSYPPLLASYLVDKQRSSRSGWSSSSVRGSSVGPGRCSCRRRG